MSELTRAQVQVVAREVHRHLREHQLRGDEATAGSSAPRAFDVATGQALPAHVEHDPARATTFAVGGPPPLVAEVLMQLVQHPYWAVRLG
jgi:hypothetical protein